MCYYYFVLCVQNKHLPEFTIVVALLLKKQKIKKKKKIYR